MTAEGEQRISQAFWLICYQPSKFFVHFDHEYFSMRITRFKSETCSWFTLAEDEVSRWG